MNFVSSLIPTANAAIDTAAFGKVVNPIIDQIIYPIVYVVFALAVVIFAYGIIEMIIKGGDASARSTGRSHMLFGAIGMFIMISAWGIITFVSNTLKSIVPNGSGIQTSIQPSQQTFTSVPANTPKPQVSQPAQNTVVAPPPASAPAVAPNPGTFTPGGGSFGGGGGGGSWAPGGGSSGGGGASGQY